ncbi:MAG: zinc ABC transporter substrate-binding protein [Candidatus Delongbacteria bacterium]|nr:zinc ABC transporter substrate-binding protein [Candidatus Delongbacteria bacterium]
MYFKSVLIIVIFTIILASCTTELKQDNIISVSVLPQKYFIERIVGDKFNINVVIPPGSSPATYEPTPANLISLSHSPLYFRIGYIGFEKAWMEKITSVNPKMKIVDTSKGVKLITSDHHHEGKEEVGVNPHIWLSPSAVKIQAYNIYNSIIEIDKANAEFYKNNYELFIKDINKLDMQIKIMFKNITNRKFIVYHPAWSYFAKDYNLIQVPIEFEGKSPSPATIKNIIDIAKKENIKVVLVQKQFDTKQANAIAENIKGHVIQLDPLSEDWIMNMVKIARTFQFELQE